MIQNQLKRWLKIVSVCTWSSCLLGSFLLLKDFAVIALLILLMLFMNIPAIQYLRARANATDASFFSVEVYEEHSTPQEKHQIDVGICVIALFLVMVVVVRCGQLLWWSR